MSSGLTGLMLAIRRFVLLYNSILYNSYNIGKVM